MAGMLIEEYCKDDFQRRLHAAWRVSDKGPQVTRAQNKDRTKKSLCLPIQLPIIEEFGFEGNEKGVQHSLSALGPTSEVGADPEVAELFHRMSVLVNPDLQEPRGDLEEEGALAEETAVQLVKVELNGVEEEVQVHSKFGPVVLQLNGKEQYFRWADGHPDKAGTKFVNDSWLTKNWPQRSSTEKTVLINLAAKKNRSMRDRLGLA